MFFNKECRILLKDVQRLKQGVESSAFMSHFETQPEDAVHAANKKIAGIQQHMTRVVNALNHAKN